MPRRRLAVALLVPEPVATEVDGLRRACGDPRRGRIAPHITLVRPVNITEGELDAALTVCRMAARSVPPLQLVLGAPRTFAPETPLAWLSVGGDLDAVSQVHDRLNDGVLARPVDHPFVPHVTISGKVADARLNAMLSSLVDFEATVSVDGLHVLENCRLPDGRWGWVPVDDVAFGRPAVVGRGGIALELSVGRVLDPEAAALLAMRAQPGGGPLVVTARRDGTLVGAAIGMTDGDVAGLEALVVAEGHRRQGVGSHLLAMFATEAARRGCRIGARIALPGDGVSELCRRRGWSGPISDATAGPATLVRTLAGG